MRAAAVLFALLLPLSPPRSSSLTLLFTSLHYPKIPIIPAPSLLFHAFSAPSLLFHARSDRTAELRSDLLE
jgi:hypothetical protein